MIYAVVFALGIIIFLIVISLLTKKETIDDKLVDKFTEWIKDHHAYENFRIVVNKNIITSTSKSLEVSFNFEKGNGLYNDKALNKVYSIVYIKDKFYILED